MKDILVSIVIPVYNTGKYLKECVDSVISQTHANIEIIIVNDGSTDDSATIINNIAKQHHNVTVVSQENRGLAGARCSGMTVATGDFLMFLDSDDTLPVDAIEFLVNKMVENQLDAIYGNYNRVFDSKIVAQPPRDFEGVLTGEEMLNKIFNPYYPFLGCMCFSRRELWDETMFSTTRELPSEDFLTNTHLLLRCYRVGIYNKHVYNYFFRNLSLTSTRKYFKAENWKQLFGELRAILSSYGKLEPNTKNLEMKEIDALGFQVVDLSPQDEWYQRVLSYDTTGQPLKIKVLHMLLHCPWLLHILVNGNRRIKSWLGLSH